MQACRDRASSSGARLSARPELGTPPVLVMVSLIIDRIDGIDPISRGPATPSDRSEARSGADREAYPLTEAARRAGSILIL